MILGGHNPYFQQTQWTPLSTVDGVPVPADYVPQVQPQAMPLAGWGASTIVGGGYASSFQPPSIFNPMVPQGQHSVPSAFTGNQVLYAHYAPNGTATTPAAQPPATPAPAPAPKPDEKKPEPKTVTVKSGDSLSKIAAANGTTWQKLYELNKDVVGGNPNLIRPGQQLKMP